MPISVSGGADPIVRKGISQLLSDRWIAIAALIISIISLAISMWALLGHRG